VTRVVRQRRIIHPKIDAVPIAKLRIVGAETRRVAVEKRSYERETVGHVGAQ
jgi:hypothetical protein